MISKAHSFSESALSCVPITYISWLASERFRVMPSPWEVSHDVKDDGGAAFYNFMKIKRREDRRGEKKRRK